jgi:hypothetical protein
VPVHRRQQFLSRSCADEVHVSALIASHNDIAWPVAQTNYWKVKVCLSPITPQLTQDDLDHVAFRIQLAVKSRAKDDARVMGMETGPAAQNAAARVAVTLRIPRARGHVTLGSGGARCLLAWSAATTLGPLPAVVRGACELHAAPRARAAAHLCFSLESNKLWYGH